MRRHERRQLYTVGLCATDFRQLLETDLESPRIEQPYQTSVRHSRRLAETERIARQHLLKGIEATFQQPMAIPGFCLRRHVLQGPFR